MSAEPGTVVELQLVPVSHALLLFAPTHVIVPVGAEGGSGIGDVVEVVELVACVELFGSRTPETSASVRVSAVVELEFWMVSFSAPPVVAIPPTIWLAVPWLVAPLMSMPSVVDPAVLENIVTSPDSGTAPLLQLRLVSGALALPVPAHLRVADGANGSVVMRNWGLYPVDKSRPLYCAGNECLASATSGSLAVMSILFSLKFSLGNSAGKVEELVACADPSTQNSGCPDCSARDNSRLDACADWVSANRNATRKLMTHSTTKARVESIASFGRDTDSARVWRREKSPRVDDRSRRASGGVGRGCMEIGKGGGGR
jgi:hypothetical protein